MENFVERLVTSASAKAKIIDAAVLPAEIWKELKKNKPMLHEMQGAKFFKENVAEFETQLIRQALEENGWNQSQAARQLRIPV